ncbi:leukocyte receptor cluster member 1 homolog [Musca vetustissima]|uniref:leukocyte receptor cluster member 1 homolog n=1 Tax=Musca vetustissima TaxID=27455 RepID=UPI002AB6CE14|nr:leukocyte receptor cluster member 1 homolog [Musca vetustissima]
MNILPKKRWHVRTKDNIARVRRDEAAAREEERKKQEKLEFAESEARINFLRTKSGLPEKHREEVPTTAEDDEATSSGQQQHVNLFADYKTHVKTTNKELEREKKEEQEKYEKKIGYLTYLGQDTNEALRLKSWYEVAPKRIDVGDEREIVEKDLKTKHNQDPLTFIKAVLPPETKIEIKTSNKRKRSPTPVPPPTPETKTEESDVKRHKKHKKDRKKHKKEKHKKRDREHKQKKKKKSKDRDEDDVIQKRLKLEQLRKERLRREMIEKARQEALLAPKKAIQPSEQPVTPRVVQKYNSQFNPELAKQNMN